MDENITKVKERMQYTFTGCKCKTGCATRRCSCKKRERKCGPGCKCLACTNTNATTAANTPEVDTSLADNLRAIEVEEIQEMTGDGDDELAEDSEADLSDIEVDKETDEIMQ